MLGEGTNLAWVLVCAILVFIMQAGFLAVEVGMTRTKNSTNVALKNIADFALSAILFWAVGYGLMFGISTYSVIGSTEFFPDFYEASSTKSSFFFFQLMFCCTAVTIISGASSERMKFQGYLIVAIFVSTIIYPVFGHWAWNTSEDLIASGWLNQLGFIDFAGSTVVHSVGGWVALAAVLVIGPRTGRFPNVGKNEIFFPSSIPLASLGAILIFFGWFGFNGGSLLNFDSRVPHILIHTALAGGAGVLVVIVSGYIFSKYPSAYKIINGLISGLVAITASADVVSTLAAILIGGLGAVAMLMVSSMLEKARIDDAVGAIPAHLGAGIAGTLLVPIFSDPAHLSNDYTWLEQLGAQAVGVITCGIWSFGLAYLLLRSINRYFPLRVSQDDEKIGLNMSEHGEVDPFGSLIETMEKHARKGLYENKAEVQPYTEAGRIAKHYNDLTTQLVLQMNSTNLSLGKYKVAANELTQLVNTANAPIFGVDKEGLINEWNRKAEEITGYSKNEAIGRNLVEEFLAIEFKGAVQEVLNQAMQGNETANYRFPLFTKSGERIDILLNSTTRRNIDGDITGVIGVGQDITELNNSYKDLEQLGLIVDAVDQSIVLFDDDERIIFCNKAYRELNADIAEFNKSGTLFEDHLRAGVKAGLMIEGIGRENEWVAERLEHHRSSQSTIEVKRQDGRIVLVSEKKMEHLGSVLLISDITELKHSQAQVIQASKLASLGEMATSVAHELNQPLNTIRMAASNVLDRIELNKVTPEYLTKKLQRIEKQVVRASNIIDHMRMFGRKAVEKPENLNPRNVMNSVLELMGEQLRLANIEVTTRCDHECPVILGNQIQLEQVFLNILSNSRDAILENGRNAERKITITGTPVDDDKLEISFSDTGGGIPIKLLPHIFDPFITSKAMGKGTGLGLSVSYGIIREMNGTITAENIRGGSRIKITIPIAA